MTEAYIADLLQSCGVDLSYQELMVLEQEWAAEEEGEDSSPAPHQLTTRLLVKALAYFDAGLQVVSDNDPNLEHSLKVCPGINNVMSCYWELLKEKRRPK